MSIRKRVGNLERTVRTHHAVLPEAERVQVLGSRESMEQRKAAVIDKYGSARGVLFVRIKGRDS